MAPYSMKFARPFDAWYLVIAAVNVVLTEVNQTDIRKGMDEGFLPCRDRRGQWYLWKGQLEKPGENETGNCVPMFT